MTDTIVPRKQRSDLLGVCPMCGRRKKYDDGVACSVCLNSGSNAWGTAEELGFLRSRSERGSMIAGAFVTAKDFLAGYLAGARLRTDWGHIDRDTVMAEAQRLLDARS